MICLDQRDKDTTYLNYDINSLYEGLWWNVEKINSETTWRLIKWPPNKHSGEQSQDSSLLPDFNRVIILTLIGPNSLMAARYIQRLQCTVAVIWVTFKSANRNTNYWSKVSCFKTSRLELYIDSSSSQKKETIQGRSRVMIDCFRTTLHSKIRRDNKYCIYLKEPAAWTRLIINLNRNNCPNSLDKVLLIKGARSWRYIIQKTGGKNLFISWIWKDHCFYVFQCTHLHHKHKAYFIESKFLCLSTLQCKLFT